MTGLSADKHVVITLAVMAAVASVIVVLWTTTIETMKEHEHRITKLEQTVKVLNKEKDQ